MSEFVVKVRSKAPSSSPIPVPKPDDSFFYVGSRALSYWPYINENGAFFLKDDLEPLIGTKNGFTFGLANLRHKIGNTIGSIREEAATKDGVYFVAQIDRRAAELHDATPEDFSNGGEFSDASVEILCNRDKSQFVAVTNPNSDKLEDQKVFTAKEVEELGIRRTNLSDAIPYYYQGKYAVGERCVPTRCRGVAFLDDPADTTANVFEVAAARLADMERSDAHAEPYGDVAYADPGFRGKKRYPIDREHIHAALSYWGKPENKSKYTKEQQDHISRAINTAKKKFGIGEEKSSGGFGSTEVPEISPSMCELAESDLNNAMMDHYRTITPLNLESCYGDMEQMPDDGFAESHFDPEEVEDKRSFPLYESVDKYMKDEPHAGLVKGAYHAFKDGKMPDRAQALQRIQKAHNHLFPGDIMTPEEKAALEQRVSNAEAALATEQASKTTELAAKDTEIAALTAKVAELETKNTELSGAIATRDAEEKANKRFTELSSIEGFEVKDEEKAALLKALATESDVEFSNRKLTTEVASLKQKQTKGGSEETAGKSAQERAELISAALLGIDVTPQGNGSEVKSAVELF